MFWLDLQNQCIDAACRIDNCIECNLGGPTICDKCDENYALAPERGIFCYNTICSEGYEFNEQSGYCEDVVCKIDKCEECKKSGIFEGCDRCTDGYFFDKEAGECLPLPPDLSCKV